MTALRPAQPPVGEMFPNRHRTRRAADVVSPSRAAGGFPTLGGGVRARTGQDMARRAAPASRDAGGAGEGGG